MGVVDYNEQQNAASISESLQDSFIPLDGLGLPETGNVLRDDLHL